MFDACYEHRGVTAARKAERAAKQGAWRAPPAAAAAPRAASTTWGRQQLQQAAGPACRPRMCARGWSPGSRWLHRCMCAWHIAHAGVAAPSGYNLYPLLYPCAVLCGLIGEHGMF